MWPALGVVGAAWPAASRGGVAVVGRWAVGRRGGVAGGWVGWGSGRVRRMGVAAAAGVGQSPWLAAVQGGVVPWSELRERADALGGLPRGARAATGVALVRCVPGEDTMVLAVEVVGRQFTMLRRKDEAVGSALARLTMNVDKAAGRVAPQKARQKRGAGGGQAGQTSTAAGTSNLAQLLEGDGVTAVDGGMPNEEAWAPGRVLVVGEERLSVRVNEPIIGAPQVEGNPIVGCPLAPLAVAEFCELGEGAWRWERLRAGEVEWSVVGREHVYVPGEADVGAALRVSCAPPGAALLTQPGTTLPPVAPGPDRAPHARRLAGAFAARASGGALRVMTYNVLADAYSKFWGTLHWYCPEDKLVRGYRLPLLAREVLDFHPDVVSLQEVDVRSYEVFWAPQMRAAGFEGYMTPKSGEPTEGCALFWRTDRLRAVSQQHIAFRDLAREAIERGGSGGGGEAMAWLADLVRANPPLENVFAKVKSIAQVAVLEEVGGNADGDSFPQAGRRVIVTNTHAFFHPNAGAVRAVQAKLLTGAVEQELAAQGPGTGVILTGDFNSQSYDLSVKFLLQGELSPAEDEWASSSLFRWGRDDDEGGDGDAGGAEGGPAGGGKGKDTRGRVYTYTEIMGYLDEAIGTADPFVAADCYKHVRRTLARLQEGVPPEEAAGASAEASSSPPTPTAEELDELRARAASMLDTVQGLRERARAKQAEACTDFVPPDAEDAAVVGVGAYLRHGLSLKTAIGFPEFTNYVDAFQGDLDWILVGDAALEPVAHAPFPSAEEVTRNVAMPSEVWPSDHVSCVADIAWRS